MSFRKQSPIHEQHVNMASHSGRRGSTSLRYKSKFYATTAPRRHSFHMCGQPPPAFTLVPKRRYSSLSESTSHDIAEDMHFEKEVHDLLLAVENHNEMRVRQILLIHSSIGPVICTTTINNISPLHLAAWNGLTGITNLMLKCGADANAQTPAQTTLRYNAVTEMEFSAGSTPLHFASAKGHEEEVMELIDSCADVNRRDYDGNCPMQKATAMGHLDVVKILIQNKALINLEDSYEQTPLHWAVYRKKNDIIQLLLRNGANPNHISQNGRTPLHTAARRCFTEGVVKLLDNGADVNIQDEHGQTALHLATLEWLETGNGDAIVLLIEHGCDDTIIDQESKTAQDYAGLKDIRNIKVTPAPKVKKNKRGSMLSEGPEKLRHKKEDKNACTIL